MNILGVAIATVNMDEAVSTILEWIQRDEKQYVCVTGVHGVMACQSDPQLKEIHNLSGLTDPLPILWTVERLSEGGLRACLF